MLNFLGSGHRFCDGVSRRDFLSVGALALGGLALPDVLRGQAKAGTAGRQKAAIMIFLSGGPSHLDTYDMKPDLGDDYRGEFKPIQTAVPGMEICELLPLQAKIADKIAVLRGVHTVGNHTGNEFFSGFAYEEGNAGALDNMRRHGSIDLAHLQDRAVLRQTFDTLQRDLDATGALGRPRCDERPGAGDHHVEQGARRLRPQQRAEQPQGPLWRRAGRLQLRPR